MIYLDEQNKKLIILRVLFRCGTRNCDNCGNCGGVKLPMHDVDVIPLIKDYDHDVS